MSDSTANPSSTPPSPGAENALLDLLLAQRSELAAIRQTLDALRKEVADLKTGRHRSKPQALPAPAAKPALGQREVSKMMFISWASRQPSAYEGESAEARQRRLLPEFERQNHYRVLNVDALRSQP